MLSVIVNADDLGRSEGINDAIFSALADGVVSSATIMATGKEFNSAVKRCREFPKASFGVHMNLTTHRPLTSNANLRPLLDEEGEFLPDGVYQAPMTSSLRAAVASEWLAQVARVQDAGIRISHLDSHHHIHTIPGLFGPLKHVQRNFGLRRVRGTWTVYTRAVAPGRMLRVKKQAWLLALRALYRTRTADEFCDFLMFRSALEEGSYAPHTWPRAIELMVHPDDEVPERADEAATLRSGWMAALPVPARLVSYEIL